MRITINSQELSAKLQTLSKVINTKSSMQILDCILFSVTEDGLTLKASDSTMLLSAKVDLISQEGTGNFCIKAKNIISAVKELSDQPIDLDVDLQTFKVNISFLNGEFALQAEDAVNYPLFQGLKEDEGNTFEIPSKVLHNLINKTIWATACDDLRMVMNGICLNFVEKGLDMVASDGHKLAKITYKGCKLVDDSKVESKSFLLPKKPANLLLSSLRTDDKQEETPSVVKVRFNEKCASFSYDEGELECRLLEGRYPKYDSVIPRNNTKIATIDKGSLQSSIKRVMPFTSSTTALTKMVFEKSRISISGEDIDYNTSAHENIYCQYNDESLTVGVKGTALIETLKNIDCDNALFKMDEPNRSFLILPEKQEEDTEVLLLLMPMMIG